MTRSKHPRKKKPSDADLRRNPGIGSSKGTGIGKATPEDLEDFEGENTFPGDVKNDTNPQGGLGRTDIGRTNK